MANTDYLPAMGRHWLLPLYDTFSWLARVGRVHEQLLDRAGLQNGQRVLEIGCGTGNLLRALGRRKLEVDATGIDPDPAALRLARRKAARAKLPIRYEQAFAGALPAPDEAFDRVLSSFMLHHLPDGERQQALREVRRVLHPGGQLHVVDVDVTGSSKAHRNAQVAESTAERMLTELTEAKFTKIEETGRVTGHFGVFAFYEASAPSGQKEDLA
ncbi:MAG: methyltransferase domain-containing protein [Propionibacteriaceae bacterium]